MSNISSINQVNSLNNYNSLNKKIDRANFNQLFNQAVQGEQEVKISAHAEKRMIERNIQLDDEDLAKISDSMDKASQKGANEALIMYKDIMMIASIRNRTIITAIDQNKTEENIITNVDSAIFVK